MKFINKKSQSYKWIEVGAIWIGKNKDKKKSVTIKFNDDMEVLKTDKFKGFIHSQAGMGVEKNGKPSLNPDGKQYTYPDYKIFIPADKVQE